MHPCIFLYLDSFEVLTKMRKKLKRSKTILKDLKTILNDLKPSKTTKNSQCRNLTDLSKVFIRLRFSNAGWDSLQNKRGQLQNKKLDLWLESWRLTSSYNLHLKHLGPRNSEPLEKLKSSRLQMFSRIVSIKTFAVFNLCWVSF